MASKNCCVISSFITKPQPGTNRNQLVLSCVISSFITKPQLQSGRVAKELVALYPLSSPNHNLFAYYKAWFELRYILFHHQTTTYSIDVSCIMCCVISSFITKPQPAAICKRYEMVALYPLSSPNHNNEYEIVEVSNVALYPLSSPNHNDFFPLLSISVVALYPLSSPNHNMYSKVKF